ncbi:MAG TPA: DUF3300 domain-containing protein [Burkholderiaceae bacterium]|nr:DUF3300 domain-containing protein [Burkholderiaceae bacterium]
MNCKPALPVVLSLAIGFTPVTWAQTATSAAAAPQGTAAAQPFSQGELESMLAPIALYPDALLSQIMMASTYPLEIVEAARWRKANASLEGKALEDALQKQSWDESVKSLTAFPDVLDRMNQDLAWTQKLGDAFLAQQDQVMDTIQSLRAKAQTAGHLQSNEQQKVEVQKADNKQYIIIEPANPQIVYVPVYQPTVVYGAWGYPAYPPYYPSYWYPPGAAFVGGFFWGAGIAAGAALWGGWGWHNHDVNINVNRYNNFNRTNISNTNWNHNVNHRGAVPYRDAGSRDKYRQNDRQAVQAREQFRGRDDSLGGAGLNDRKGLQEAQRDHGNRPATGAGTRDAAPGRGQAGTRDMGSGRGDAGAASRNMSELGSGNRPAASRGDHANAFSGGNGAQARQASSRGHSSMAAAPRGGGAARAGGGGGGRGGRR